MNSKYFDIAKKWAEKSSYKFRLGAVLVHGKEVYTGFNKGNVTHSRSNNNFKTIHAELSVLLASGWPHRNIVGSELYVYRITKDSNGKGLSKPCSFCEALLKQAGIKRIYYTTQSDFGTLSLR